MRVLACVFALEEPPAPLAARGAMENLFVIILNFL